MSMFGSIMHKIFSHGSAAAAPAATPTAAPAATPDVAAPAPAMATAAGDDAPAPSSVGSATGSAGQTVATEQPSTAQPVDVAAVCTEIASHKGGGGNWQTSIVDLLKLLDLDSGLDARKQLADELNVHAGAPGTPEENVALHHAVMAKLAENGGKVPDSMRG